MIKNFIIISLLTVSVFPQTKYLIYFKDKGGVKQNVLNKTPVFYKEALSKLSVRSIERRKKAMGNDIITYEDIPLDDNYLSRLESLNIKPINKLRWFNAVSVYLTDVQLQKVSSLSFVKQVRRVKTLSINPVIEKLFTNNNSLLSLDSLYGNSYTEYNLSDIPEVYQKGIDGSGVVVGILDNGFKWKDHQALNTRKVIAEYNFVFHDTSTAPQPGDAAESGNHGSAVFSLIGGYEPGKIIGPAHGASFILAKTEDDRSESHIEEDNYAAALQWMESLGVDITTSSLGYNIFDDTTYSYTYDDLNGNTTIVTKAVNLAFQRGVLCFTAAGNEGADSWQYVDAPADAFNVIAVGAVNQSNIRASFSSIGPTADGRIKPDIVAMGVSNYVADASGGSNAFSYGSGTSYATPIASGIGAMLLSVYPEISNVQARNIILTSSENSQTPNDEIGYGLISAKNVLSFPVIDSTSNGYEVNKIFFSENGIDTASVFINYPNNDNVEAEKMSHNGNLKYFMSLKNYITSDSIHFYFTYKDSAGNSFRDPASKYYSVKYGDDIISIANFSSTSKPYDSSEVSIKDVYPNPFNISNKMIFSIPVDENVKIGVYNVLGQKIKTLLDSYLSAGQHNIVWDGTNNHSQTCASGIYFYILQIGTKKYSKKMVFLK